MSVLSPERRTAMYHAQLSQGAVMADADGWQLPVHYGDPAREANWLRGSVGVSDVSPIGKVRMVGRDAAHAVTTIVPQAGHMPIGSVLEASSALGPGGKLLAVRLASDEFLVLTPAGVAPLAIDALRSGHSNCAYAVDVTSALCGVSIVGPATTEILSRVTEMDSSPRALPDLACVQSRFAEVHGLLLRRDVKDIAIYQLYAGREFGECLWEALVETAHDLGGGPVGTQALLGLASSD